MTGDQQRTGWRLLLAIALAFAVTMALVPQPPPTPIGFLGDKWQHMLAFATIAVLAALSYPQVPLLRVGERLSFLGALIEMVQAIPALHRDCDILDWVADTVAIALVLIVVAAIRRRVRAGP